MTMTRRRFLVGSAASVGASAAAAATKPSGDASMLPIVDTHQHLWDLTRIRPPWLKEGNPLARNHVMSDYLEAARGLNIVKAVYMEVAVADADLVAEADHVVKLCRRSDNPTVAAVIGGRPASDGFREYITRYKNSPYVKGVRQIVHRGKAKAHPCLAPAFVRGVRLLGELGMSFDLCVGPDELSDGAKLVERCPDTRFIVDHCGNADPRAFGAKGQQKRSHDPDVWKRGIDALARHSRAVCKISGIVARMPKGKWSADELAPVINHCLDTFGPDRVMFASDWPVCTRGATLRQWVEALKQIVRTRPAAERRKLFHDNAVSFYGLKR
jgi:L-fuconolactonase